jgi:DNA-binding PadR family transcriptional regulator
MDGQHMHTTHSDTSHSDTTHTVSRSRRGRGRTHRMHDHDHHHFSEHSRGGGRQRARRGAVPIAILTLLDERAMHGYEIITELETRSEGRWRPSPGAIYPTLDKLEAREMLVGTDVDGKRQFTLTDKGRTFLTSLRDAQGDDGSEPWEHRGTGGRGEMRRLMSELGGQVRQVARFGTTEQRDAAKDVLEDAKRKLYAILASPPAPTDD